MNRETVADLNSIPKENGGRMRKMKKPSAAAATEGWTINDKPMRIS